MRLDRVTMKVPAALLAAALAAPAAGQASFEWRLGGSLEHGQVRSTGPDQRGQPTMLVFGVSVDRSIGSRFSVGLDWTGARFDAPYGREQRQSLALTGSVYAWRGLHLAVGAGPGLVSWRTVYDPPEHGVGDGLVVFSDGDPALALVAGVGYDLALGGVHLTPRVRVLGHRLHGETVGMVMAGVKLGL